MLRPYLRMLRPYLRMLRPYTNTDPAQFDHMGPDVDPELFQQHLAHRAARDPRHRLARARPLQDVPRVLAVVLERAGEIGVPRGRARGPAPPPRFPPRPPGGGPRGPLPLATVWRGGQGVRSHRRGGACGLMFVMVGSETTTSPRVVIPNRYCWPLVASNATRNGPMIGSRIAIFFCWLKKKVSNTRMLVSGDAVNTMRSLILPEPPPQLTAQLGPGSKLWL